MKIAGVCVFIFGLQIISGAYLEITNMPASVSLYEDDKGPTFLYSLVVYSSTTQPTCTLDNSDYTITLGTHAEPGTGQWDISTKASATFDATATPSVDITATCGTETGILTVTFTNNVAPVFTQTSGQVFISAKTARAGHVIYSVEYTDVDSDSPLTYTNMVVTPVSTLFKFQDDQLILLDDIPLIKTAQFNITVDAADERTTTSLFVQVDITDRNTVPIFLKTSPASVNYTEDTTGRKWLYTITPSDADGDPVQISYYVTDATNDIFDLVEATGEVYLISGNTFDYETLANYTLIVSLSDYLETAASIFTLSIEVTDVNEDPYYTGVPDSFTVPESAAGTVIGVLSELCTDPDTSPPETIIYFIIPGGDSDYFTINDTSAEVSFLKEFDYDDTTLANEVNITVRCVDTGSNTDETTVSINITDINDNTPICSPSQTIFKLQYNQAITETLVNLACSDIDSTVNAELEYSKLGFSGGYTQTYFDVDTDGNVSISSAFTMDFNTSFYVTFLINDKGTPSLSATVTLTVTYTEEPKIVTYTQVSPCFLCTTSALTIIAALGLVGFMFFICVLVLCVLRCCYSHEQGKIRKALSKAKKNTWRWFGCLRPAEERKPKKTKDEIAAAQKKDEEYIRARNALLGIDDPSDSTIPPASGSTGKVNRRHNRQSVTSGTVSTALSGRERGPEMGMKSVDKQSLTISQKEQLEKFKEMKKSTDGPSKPGPSSQAASGMV